MENLQDILTKVSGSKFATVKNISRIANLKQSDLFKVKRLENMNKYGDLARENSSVIVTCPNCGCSGPKKSIMRVHFDKCVRPQGMDDSRIFELYKSGMTYKQMSDMTGLKVSGLEPIIKKQKKILHSHS
jgi:hypothetical protein